MAFPPEFTERIKAANPIADVIGEYVTLKRTGRDYVGLCPFHNEKTPSFHVHPDKEYFYCFGCQAGGDVITFIMRYQNLDYMETMRLLADRGNIEMPTESNNFTYETGQGSKRHRVTLADKKRVFEMNREAAKFYYRQLFTEDGKRCLHYLIDVRGLTAETIKHYGMGFAPGGWHALKDYMLSKGYTEKELEYAHLISKSEKNPNHTFDFFVNRAVFPFIDLRGNILGFGGRALGEDKRKYINPIDSAFYDKNKFLFSLNFAKNSAVKTGKFILCEGNLDVISLAQAGFDNAIASCGTALTEGQVKLLNSYANEIVICYDADEAGRKATLKAIDLIRSCGFKASVVTVKGAKDPDEFIRKYGAAAFGNLLEKAETALDYRLRIERERVDMSTQKGRFDFKDAVIPILAGIEKKTEYEYYAKEAAAAVEVSFTAIDEEVNALKTGRRRSEKRREEQSVRNFTNYRDSITPEASLHVGEFNAEEMLLTYLYLNPDKVGYIMQNLPPEAFVTAFNRRVYEFLLDRIKGGYDYSLSSMPEVFSMDEVSKITGMIARRQALSLTDEVASECIGKLNDRETNLDLAHMTDDEIRAFMEEEKKKNK